MRRLQARHYTFLGLAVVITVTMLLNIRLDTRVSPYTRALHDYIESLPPGSVLMVSFDHEASSLPEIRPIARSVLRHAFRKGHRLIGVSLLAEGTLIGYRLMQETAAEYGRQYGSDYVYLGFRPQYIAAILAMGESIRDTYPRDYLGRPYDQFELLRSVENYDDVAAVLSIADGSLTTHWMEYGQARYGVVVLGAVTAAMATTYDPYLASAQMHAMMAGLRGAAEYEKLIGIGGGGARGMLAQSSAHLYVILLIVLGNVAYFVRRREGRRD
ncbi:MAG: hypothetical protein JSW34_14015 [Candidatus Zixiibacteriota bacterium]|nr:MAG: hypothetical protein JSW34_14015 [candidate division Zixibacteria bacterium]